MSRINESSAGESDFSNSDAKFAFIKLKQTLPESNYFKSFNEQYEVLEKLDCNNKVMRVRCIHSSEIRTAIVTEINADFVLRKQHIVAFNKEKSYINSLKSEFLLNFIEVFV